MIKHVTVDILCEVEIPDERIADLLKDFREMISPNATEDDLFRHIGWTMARERYSGEDFVEGIGRLEQEGIRFEEVGDDISVDDA